MGSPASGRWPGYPSWPALGTARRAEPVTAPRAGARSGRLACVRPGRLLDPPAEAGHLPAAADELVDQLVGLAEGWAAPGGARAERRGAGGRWVEDSAVSSQLPIRPVGVPDPFLRAGDGRLSGGDRGGLTAVAAVAVLGRGHGVPGGQGGPGGFQVLVRASRSAWALSSAATTLLGELICFAEPAADLVLRRR